MQILGHVKSNINLRTSPSTSNTSNISGVIYSNQTFEGSGYVTDSLSRKWIKLTKVNGILLSGQYIAAFVPSVSVDREIQDVPVTDEPLGAPSKVTMIEEFIENGVTKTRTTTWENPTITTTGV